MPDLKAAIHRHHLGRHVRLVGSLSNDSVQEIMAASDALLLCSDYEGIPIVVYEAMGVGLPQVVSDVGGISELVTPDCGYLVTPGAGEIAAYAASLLALAREPDKARAMGEAARERVVRHFDLSAMRQRMDEVFAEARRRASQRHPVAYTYQDI